MAAVHMEVCEKLPDGFDSIHSERWLTDLECMPRSDLQALAKELGIAANRESSMIIVEILQPMNESHVNKKFFGISRRHVRCCRVSM